MKQSVHKFTRSARAKRYARTVATALTAVSLAALGAGMAAGPAAATVYSCSDTFDVVSPVGAGNFVATLDITNTGSGLSGWGITIGYPTHIIMVAASAGSWSQIGSGLAGAEFRRTGGRRRRAHRDRGPGSRPAADRHARRGRLHLLTLAGGPGGVLLRRPGPNRGVET